MESGKLIRELREERFVKSTDIERISRLIASDKGNADFSHPTLADVETGSVPSIHKLYNLAACFKVPLEELLLVFGIDASESRHLAGQPEPGVRGPSATEGREPGLRFRLNFDASSNSHETSLLRLHP
jgi:transcriptional regulator with XRE-family HTH domain